MGDTIQRENLLDRVNKVGDQMMKGLLDLCKEHPAVVANARGRGTFCAIDCGSPAIRDKLVGEMRKNGVHLGVCGEQTLRFRPSLTFDDGHLAILMDRLKAVIKRL